MQKLPRNFSIENQKLKFKNFDIFELAEKYDTPLRVNDPSCLVENYTYLKDVVTQELSDRNLPPEKFECGYAIKANQHHDLVKLASKHTDFLEASSENDLYALELLKDEIGQKKIICHGFKTKDSVYFKKIIELLEKNFNIIPVIDSVDELRAFYEVDRPMKIGVRLATTSVHEGQNIYDRFGITYEQIEENTELFANTSKLEVVMLHVHVSNTIKDVSQRIGDMKELFKLYMELSMNNHKVSYLNCGGGLPGRSKVDVSFYKKYYGDIFDSLQVLESDNFPIIMTESGRFLSSDSQFLILKVIETKQNNPNFTWFLLNGSAINLIPETMLDESMEFPILPVKHFDNELIDVICAGITCDPEDYFHHGIMQLPKPHLNENTYVVIPETGAYQESLLGSARGGHGHCLIEGPKEITLLGESIIESTNKNHFLSDLKYS